MGNLHKKILLMLHILKIVYADDVSSVIGIEIQTCGNGLSWLLKLNLIWEVWLDLAPDIKCDLKDN